MNETDKLVDAIVNGIHEKKGREVAVMDLSGILTAPAQRFVLCTCSSPTQLSAVTDSVEEFAHREAGEKPAAICGKAGGTWVAMDFGTVMAHLFLPEAREHYDLEHLYDDAPVVFLADVD